MSIPRQTSAVDLWLDGDQMNNLNPAQLREVATYLMAKRSDAYLNAKHPDHRLVSREIERLHELAVQRTPEGEMPV